MYFGELRYEGVLRENLNTFKNLQKTKSKDFDNLDVKLLQTDGNELIWKEYINCNFFKKITGLGTGIDLISYEIPEDDLILVSNNLLWLNLPNQKIKNIEFIKH